MKSWALLHRSAHRWISIAACLPIVVIAATGLLLQVKKDFPWIQPRTMAGSPGAPTLSFEEILKSARGVPAAGIHGWEEVERLDVRPERGLVKILTKGRWEIQIDARTGRVLHAAVRRSDLIESLHDGSFFHPLAKRWLFLPAGIALLVLTLTGLYLFALPLLLRRRAQAARAPAAAPCSPAPDRGETVLLT